MPTFSSVIGNANKTKEKADLKAAITTYIADHSNDGTDLPDFNEYIFVKGANSNGTISAPTSAPTDGTTVYFYKNGEITEGTVASGATVGSSAERLGTTEWFGYTYKTSDDQG